MKKKLSLILAVALLLPMMFACTPEEPAVTTDGDTTTDITTEDPDMTTTTVPADDGTTTTVAPDADTTTTAAPDDGTTTTVAPDADTTTTAAPDADTTTTAAPDGGDDDPDAGSTTTAAPDDGDDDPDAGSTTTAAPDAGSTTTAAPNGGSDDPDGTPTYPAWTATEEDDVCDILMIGNSFCQNYCDELYAMAKAAGIKCRITSVVAAACTLEMHWDYYSNEKAKYAVATYDENGRTSAGNQTLQAALALADWDVISYQDGEHYYRIEGAESAKTHMEPYLENLVGAIRAKFPNATHYFHQVWAYQVGYYRPDKSEFKVTDSTVQATMHSDLRDMSLYACDKHDLLRIPSGDAWASARADERIGDVLCMGDNEHDSERTGGQYLNACVWFETLFGKNCTGNFIDSPYLSDDTMTALQEMAHRAVADACGSTHAYDVPTLTLPEEEPEDTVPDYQKLPIDFTGNPDKGTSSLASSDFLKIGYDKDYSVYLGNLDMSKLLGVRITYGGDSSLPVKDLPIGLTSKDQAFGTKDTPDLTDAIVYTTMTEIVHSYTKGANVVTIEWMDALYSGDLYLAIPDADLFNYLQIYAVEFILMPDNLDDPNNLEIDIDNHPNKSLSGTLNRNVLTLNNTVTTVTLGEIDLSKYKSVWIYYGGDASITSDGKPIGLLSSAALDSASGTSAANVLAHGKMVDIEGRHPGAYGTRIDLSGVTDNGELFLTVFGFTANDVQIYSVEFVADENPDEGGSDVTPDPEDPSVECYDNYTYVIDENTPGAYYFEDAGQYALFLGQNFKGGDLDISTTEESKQCNQSLGVIDLSKYSKVRIVYGSNCIDDGSNFRSVGMPMVLSKAPGRIGNLASGESTVTDALQSEDILAYELMTMPITTAYEVGTTYVEIDLSDVNDSCEVYLATVRQKWADSMHYRHMQIYSIEFIGAPVPAAE